MKMSFRGLSSRVVLERGVSMFSLVFVDFGSSAAQGGGVTLLPLPQNVADCPLV